MTVRLRGTAASPGLASGTVHVLERDRVPVTRRELEASAETLDGEVARLNDAIEAGRRQVAGVRDRLRGEGLPAQFVRVLDAHEALLEDEAFAEGAARIVREERVNAEWAVRRVVQAAADALAAAEDEGFRCLRDDVEFVGERILRNLTGCSDDPLADVPPGAILAAHELSPVELAQAVRRRVAAVVTETGSRTSHSAILARGYAVPAVVGVDRLLELVSAGDVAALDGVRGEVLLRPEPGDLATFRERARAHEAHGRVVSAQRDAPAETKDGRQVRVLANIEYPAEAALALELGAEGVGLYRTEFLYLGREEAPSEEEQTRVYADVARALAPRPVTLRTFDMGADKLPGPADPRERRTNPALGLRALRLGLRERDLLRVQLRAMLRAAADGEVAIMFPMVSGVGEVRRALEVLGEARDDLARAGARFRPDVPVGCMIEVPAAVAVADLLARHVGFLSIGTNDLVQYALAVDRSDENVADLYQPLHPAILRLICQTLGAADAAGIPVASCGAMAEDATALPVLVGLGLRQVSVAPPSIPEVKAVIRALRYDAARDLAAHALGRETPEEVAATAATFAAEAFPELLRYLS